MGLSNRKCSFGQELQKPLTIVISCVMHVRSWGPGDGEFFLLCGNEQVNGREMLAMALLGESQQKLGL